MTKRRKIIGEVLKDFYGTGPMANGLADTIEEKWDGWVDDETRYQVLASLLTVEIWMWFSGGDTAALAAQKILARLNEEALS
jgi:hypothetical protein